MNPLFLLYLTAIAVLAAGIYCIYANCVHLPTHAMTKAAINVARHSDVKVKKADVLLLEISSRVGKLITLNPYKKQALTKSLKAADISIEPETWIARCYVKFAFLLLLIIPCAYLFPILIPVIFLLAVKQLYNDLKAADIKAQKKRQTIEKDLPRFTASISQELKNSRNVISILEGYKESARPAFRNELITTIGDMKSGSQETALARLDTRVGSSMLTEVVLGLEGVLHGDDESRYFDQLSHDFEQEELQRMQLESAKMPGKVFACCGAIFVCFMMIVFFVLGMQIYQSYMALR